MEGSPRKSSVTAWVLYDLANTAFSMGIVSHYFPQWIRDHAGAGRADTIHTIVFAASMGIVFFISPLLGAMTDCRPRRMPFLIWSTVICVGLTGALGFVDLRVALLFFVVANVAYQAGLQFYDSLLPEVSTPENRGKISGIGVSIGYLGSFTALALGELPWFFGQRELLFLAIAMFFLLFALPCFFLVRERGNPHPRPIHFRMMIASTKKTLHTLRSTQEYPGLLRFLIGRAFYADTIFTVILVMSLYTVNVAISSGLSAGDAKKEAALILFLAIAFAVAGGFFWGWLVDRYGPKQILNVVLIFWMVIFAVAAAVGICDLPLWVLYVVAVSAGLALGGVWTSDRPLMLRLAPPDRIGEFYGLYGMVGRFAAVIGPIIWGTVFYLAVQVVGLAPKVGQGIGILILLILMVTSYVILRPVSDQRRV